MEHMLYCTPADAMCRSGSAKDADRPWLSLPAAPELEACWPFSDPCPRWPCAACSKGLPLGPRPAVWPTQVRQPAHAAARLAAGAQLRRCLGVEAGPLHRRLHTLSAHTPSLMRPAAVPAGCRQTHALRAALVPAALLFMCMPSQTQPLCRNPQRCKLAADGRALIQDRQTRPHFCYCRKNGKRVNKRMECDLRIMLTLNQCEQHVGRPRA
jgi:hypothetical protein